MMARIKCPSDCTCFGCLEKYADPDCKKCDGDGYYHDDNDGERLDEIICGCTVPARERREKRAAARASKKVGG